jgi:hypothetical protein
VSGAPAQSHARPATGHPPPAAQTRSAETLGLAVAKNRPQASHSGRDERRADQVRHQFHRMLEELLDGATEPTSWPSGSS